MNLCAVRGSLLSIALAACGVHSRDLAPDADSGVVDAGDAGDAGHAIRHASCAQSFAAGAAEPDGIDRDPGGRPRFDLWRDLGCGPSVMWGYCDSPTELGADRCSTCLWGGEGVDYAVCVGPDVGQDCGPGSAPAGYSAGVGDATQCVTCLAAAARALVCCDKQPGYDCREWPYPADGRPGMLCARHADCEPGLECKANAHGYGTCECPENDGDGDGGIEDLLCREPFGTPA